MLVDYFGCRMRNARTSTTSSDEDYGFAPREGGSSPIPWRATTSMLSWRLWKATISVQSSSSSVSSSATREGSGSYRAYELPSAAPSKLTPSKENDESIRIHIRFPEWVKRIAADQEKQPRSKYREARRVRDREVHFPSAEMIRLSEGLARKEAFRQHMMLGKMGRCPIIPPKQFFR